MEASTTPASHTEKSVDGTPGICGQRLQTAIDSAREGVTFSSPGGRFEVFNEQLQKALTDVITLGGLLPICAWCKKIRDDQGYYHQIETFIAKHSEVKFTHGICPECRERFERDAEAAQGELRETPG